MQENGATSNIAVINQAAGGNRILADGLGPAAQGRVERDVLAHPSVGFSMIFEGVNDIGTAPFTTEAQAIVVQQLIEAFKQMITRIHTNGIPMFAATITPFGSPSNLNGSTVIQAYDDPHSEVSRQAINNWIRTSGAFDGVVDFDAVVRDPKNHSKLAPQFDSGDGLHPTPAGYKAMADAIPLSWFSEFSHGVSSFQ
jgi:lysophospholipase L1-like esterase